jgi:hypothetical protein
LEIVRHGQVDPLILGLWVGVVDGHDEEHIVDQKQAPHAQEVKEREKEITVPQTPLRTQTKVLTP